jgi:hypothetical protein
LLSSKPVIALLRPLQVSNGLRRGTICSHIVLESWFVCAGGINGGATSIVRFEWRRRVCRLRRLECCKARYRCCAVGCS